MNPKLLLVLREAKALKLREKARSRSRREASKIETKLSGRKTQMNEKEKCGGSLKKKKKKKKKRNRERAEGVKKKRVPHKKNQKKEKNAGKESVEFFFESWRELLDIASCVLSKYDHLLA